MTAVRVIGGGLAGSEAALTLADFGHHVALYDMKPHKKTPAQKLDGLCELVCSNSFRSNKSTNAVALLKDEMLALNGFLIRAALDCRVPAGDSLAVDRELFSRHVEEQIKNHPNISLHHEEITAIPRDDMPTIMATGPLTSDALAKNLVQLIGHDRLDFYDAIAPIIDAESIDMTKAFVQSRWHDDHSEGDFINCPLDKETYELFVDHLLNSSRAKMHEFEKAHYFEGCLPIEVMAERGRETLRFGPFKPVGLTDPHKNERPYAVMQLRREDKFGSSYNMVGCQTRMTIPEQKAAFALIPALKSAKYMRFGSIHRNTYIDSPHVLDQMMRLKCADGGPKNLFLAGQITGVEGYVESMAVGLMVAYLVNDLLQGRAPALFPDETAIGGLYNHVQGTMRADDKQKFVPSNITWAMIPPIVYGKRIPRAQKRQNLYDRGLLKIKEFASRDKNENSTLSSRVTQGAHASAST